MSGFGARLKRERELRGISLDEIATASKISTRLLQAIESENYSVLPGGVFNRGFIRSYARYLGLNEEDVINDYLQETHQQSEETRPVPASAAAAAATPAASPAGRFPRALQALVIVGLAVLVAAALYLKRHRPAAGPVSQPVQQIQPATAVPPTDGAPSVVVNEFQPMPEPQSRVAPGPEAPPAAITLQLDFTAMTWAKVKLDGQLQQPTIYPTGQKVVFTAQKEIELIVGNAGGFTSTLNGKPARPFGAPGEVRRIVITPDTISSLQAAQSH